MYFLLGISLTLAFLLIVNMTAAIVASGFWHMISRSIRTLSANARAQIIFLLRVGPVAAALVFVFAFVVPAYLLHEPDNSGEIVSGKLALIALLSMIAVCLAGFRVYKTWRVTRQLTDSWRDGAKEIWFEDVDVPIFRIAHPFPLMAVVGIFRPRIFVAEQVLSSLSPAEFAAAVAHEYGHMKSHDNLKRTILRVCRDLVILPFGTELDRAWADSSESAADEYAARSGKPIALDLASALIKLARIAPLASKPNPTAGICLIDEQNTDVTTRVRNLLSFGGTETTISNTLAHKFSPFAWFLPAALAGLLILHFLDQRLLLTTHEAIEHFVWIIQ